MRAHLRPYRWFLGLVCLPTLLVAAYLYVFSSNQYESGADFIVKRAQNPTRGTGAMGQVFGFTIGSDQSRSDAYLVEEFLLSHDSVRELRTRDQLVERFTRPGTDPISALWNTNPSPETLLEYFRGKVSVTHDDESGISHLRVRAFTPDDAYEITAKLLSMGEKRINVINERTYSDQVKNAKAEMDEAEAALTRIQSELTSFRQAQEDVDPMSSARAQMGMVTAASSELIIARSRLQSMGRFLSKSSPQYQALATQVAALEQQIAAENAGIAGTSSSIAGSISLYEDLQIKKEVAAQRFAAASTSFENAKADALKQQLYLTRVVEPNRPVKSTYPQRGRAVLTVFFALVVAYAIGWLVVAGVKEHSI